jgi:hypothetical protein
MTEEMPQSLLVWLKLRDQTEKIRQTKYKAFQAADPLAFRVYAQKIQMQHQSHSMLKYAFKNTYEKYQRSGTTQKADENSNPATTTMRQVADKYNEKGSKYIN